MILTVDLGNTCIKLGLFDGDKQVSFSCYSYHQETYRSLILSFIYKANKREDDIEKAVLSCVVPNLYDSIMSALESIVGDKIVNINANEFYGVKIGVPNPNEVGDDIVTMCAYAYALHQRELFIISIGTCTVISHVTKYGAFEHCIIAPGLDKMAKSLWGSAAQLPEFKLTKLPTFKANNTVDAMNVGIYNGYIGMLAFLVEGLKRDLAVDPYIICCGGLGKMVIPYVNFINEYDPDFVTKGLNYIGRNF